jgi:23S rRNA pseudouridine955/2504/2580 synthase
MGRLALHAAGIQFEDRDGKIMKLKAPYPKDLQAAIRQLEKNKR